MRKFLFLIALFTLLVGANSVKAEKVYADLSQYGDKWDGTDVTFSWSASWGNQLSPNLTDASVGIPKGDLRSWQKLVVVVDELTNCDYFRVLVYSGDDTGHNNTFKCTKTGANEFTLSGGVDYLSNVTRICLSGSSGDDSYSGSWGESPASFKVKEVYLERPDIVYIEASEIFEAPAGTTDIKNLTGTNTGWASTVVYPKELAVQGAAFGDGNGSSEGTHVNIEGYDYICFNVTTATATTAGLRVWIWDGEKGGEGSVKTLYTKPIADYATANYAEYSKITGVGTYVVNVSGYKYLKGVKAENDYSGVSAAKVSMAYMCTGDPVAYVSTGKYSLAGEAKGSATLTDALADANAVFYDATGVEGTGIDLTGVANPNALFKANSGVLSNTKNVIVSGTCANLELTDGYPFKAPADFTATAAPTYDRTFTADKTTTVCLPFALTETEASSLGTFYELNSVDGSTLNFTSVDAPEANKAYLVVPTATGITLSEENKSIAATPASLVTTESDVDFIGTLAATTIPASGVEYSYFAYNNGELVKIVDNAATLPAFRGYFKVPTTAVNNARLVTRFFNGIITGINEVVNAEAQNGVKADGKFFKNGKLVILKNGVKFNAAGAQIK